MKTSFLLACLFLTYSTIGRADTRLLDHLLPAQQSGEHEPAFFMPLAAGDLPAYPVMQLEGARTSMDQFILDIAPMVREKTKELDSEVCAKVCANQNKMGVVITTIYSHTACPIADICPRDMDPTSHDVHSHTHFEIFTPHAIDRLFLSEGGAGRGQPNFFSQGDMSTPHSYLVGRDTVLEHNGKTIRVVRPRAE